MKKILLSLVTYNAMPASMRRTVDGRHHVYVAGEWQEAELVRNGIKKMAPVCLPIAKAKHP